jgi:AraC-like DNA-binding protein
MGKRILKHSFTLLNVDYVQLDKKWNYNNVISPYYRLYLIDGGKGHVFNHKQNLLLEPRYMYIIPSFTLCNLKCPESLSQYFIHFFEESPNGISLFQNNRKVIKIKAADLDIDNFKRILQTNPNRKINRSDNPKVYEKNVYYKEYEELNNRQSEADFLETQGIILQLISKFLSSASYQEKDTSTIPSKVIELIGFIQLNLNKNLTVADLAKKVNLHPDYFSRLFLQLTGERPLPYIHGKRIERAQYLITTSNMPLSQIAEETGFINVPHFTKIFKKITSLTPGQYRQQNHSINMF